MAGGVARNLDDLKLQAEQWQLNSLTFGKALVLAGNPGVMRSEYSA